jgi:CDP-2,3-bis-(O-geranylgeranyl)-sn-glycerol synthase
MQELFYKTLGFIWFLSLAGFANMAPVFVMRAPVLSYPIDFGKTFRGKRIFGNNKTFRGIFAAVFFGTVFFIAQKALYIRFEFIQDISVFSYQTAPLAYGTVVSFGAIFGDLVKSFFKRQRSVDSGESWFPFDQTDYCAGALMFGAWFYLPGFTDALFILCFGLIFHLLFKYIGYLLHINAKAI